MCLGGTFACAEDKADRWVLAWLCPVFACLVEVQVHLPGIGIAELPHLEVYDDQTPQ